MKMFIGPRAQECQEKIADCIIGLVGVIQSHVAAKRPCDSELPRHVLHLAQAYERFVPRQLGECPGLSADEQGT